MILVSAVVPIIVLIGTLNLVKESPRFLEI